MEVTRGAVTTLVDRVIVWCQRTFSLFPDDVHPVSHPHPDEHQYAKSKSGYNDIAENVLRGHGANSQSKASISVWDANQGTRFPSAVLM